MKRLPTFEFWVATVAFSAAILAAVRLGVAQLPPCNGQTPTMGHCGEEDKCEYRSEAQCALTYGHYHEETGGISCVGGTISTHCVQGTTLMKCTCEFVCTWNPIQHKCLKTGAHQDAQGNQICSFQQEKESQSCEVPP